MKLLEHTYQVSYHLPIISRIMDRVDNLDTYPKHQRVRATNAEDAIDIVHANLVMLHNHPIIVDEAAAHPMTPRFAEDLVEFFRGRSEFRFQPVDFPIMEVKVVA